MTNWPESEGGSSALTTSKVRGTGNLQGARNGNRFRKGNDLAATLRPRRRNRVGRAVAYSVTARVLVAVRETDGIQKAVTVVIDALDADYPHIDVNGDIGDIAARIESARVQLQEVGIGAVDVAMEALITGDSAVTIQSEVVPNVKAA